MLLTKDGEPDRSTPACTPRAAATRLCWCRNAAPPRGATPVTSTIRSVCLSEPTRGLGLGTVKPLAPALGWTQAYVDAGDRVIVPCAGTAPVAIAAEREYGDGVDVLAIDVESGARNAYERRRADELEYQSGLGAFVGGESA